MIKVLFCFLFVNLFLVYVNGDPISSLFDAVRNTNNDADGKVIKQNRGDYFAEGGVRPVERQIVKGTIGSIKTRQPRATIVLSRQSKRER